MAYLPTEAREDHLTISVFVLQLLGDSDEAGAGLRAVSHLQKSGKNEKKFCFKVCHQRRPSANEHK